MLFFIVNFNFSIVYLYSDFHKLSTFDLYALFIKSDLVYFLTLYVIVTTVIKNIVN